MRLLSCSCQNDGSYVKNIYMSKQGLVPSIVAVARRARKLRGWARDGVFAEELYPHGRKQATNDLARRKVAQRRSDVVARNHRVMDDFFGKLGFPQLPKTHPMVREWEARLESIRKEEEKQTPKKRRKRTSKHKKSKTTTSR